MKRQIDFWFSIAVLLILVNCYPKLNYRSNQPYNEADVTKLKFDLDTSLAMIQSNLPDSSRFNLHVSPNDSQEYVITENYPSPF